jgi:hypothetical protein
MLKRYAKTSRGSNQASEFGIKRRCAQGRAEESLAYQSIKDVHTMNTISLTVEIGDQIESKLLLSPHILQFVPGWFTTKVISIQKGKPSQPCPWNDRCNSR